MSSNEEYQQAQFHIIKGNGETNKKNYAEDFSLENGKYINWCMSCKECFLGHKSRLKCKECKNK